MLVPNWVLCEGVKSTGQSGTFDTTFRCGSLFKSVPGSSGVGQALVARPKSRPRALLPPRVEKAVVGPPPPRARRLSGTLSGAPVPSLCG